MQLIIRCNLYTGKYGRYRIAGNFRGGANFRYFRDYPASHEIFHPRIFSQLLRIGLRESRNLKPRKLILKIRDSFSRKFAPLKITRYTVYNTYTVAVKKTFPKLVHHSPFERRSSFVHRFHIVHIVHFVHFIL